MRLQVEVVEITSRTGVDGDRHRRRGPALEAAILAAVWEELEAVGYARLTMEGVAARARTSKQVLYRRWRNRAELVLAAFRHRVVRISDAIPDTGDLRGDVLHTLRHVARHYDQIPPDVIHGLMAESVDLGPDLLSVLHEVMMTILKRAADRGEIEVAHLTPRITTLPFDLVRHDVLLRHRRLTEGALTEIVDDVFLPLVRARTPAPPPDTP
jgi:AcrR family transcriptional regulator